MKKLGLALLLVAFGAASAPAARVYLKDGSWVNARKVWREKGKVVVLVNRDSITAFTSREVNLKKTFPHTRKRRVRPVATAAIAPASVQSSQMSEKSPQPAVSKGFAEQKPSAGDGGLLRRQQREMEQRLNE